MKDFNEEMRKHYRAMEEAMKDEHDPKEIEVRFPQFDTLDEMVAELGAEEVIARMRKAVEAYNPTRIMRKSVGKVWVVIEHNGWDRVSTVEEIFDNRDAAEECVAHRNAQKRTGMEYSVEERDLLSTYQQ